MPQNPATLIWVQATQIFKKKKEKKECISENGRRNFLLRCFVFVFFHRCGPWLLCQEPDFYYRQNKSTQPVTVLRRHHYIITSRRGVLHCSISSSSSGPAAVRLSCLQMAVQAFVCGASSSLSQQLLRARMSLSALPPPLRLKLPV